MVCLGLKHGAAWWKAQMNPLSYGGPPDLTSLNKISLSGKKLFYSWKLISSKSKLNQIRFGKKSVRIFQIKFFVNLKQLWHSAAWNFFWSGSRLWTDFSLRSVWPDGQTICSTFGHQLNSKIWQTAKNAKQYLKISICVTYVQSKWI